MPQASFCFRKKKRPASTRGAFSAWFGLDARRLVVVAVVHGVAAVVVFIDFFFGIGVVGGAPSAGSAGIARKGASAADFLTYFYLRGKRNGRGVFQSRENRIK